MDKTGITWKKVFTRPGSPFKNGPFLWGVGFQEKDVKFQGNNLISSKQGQDTWYIDEKEWLEFYNTISKKSSHLSYLKSSSKIIKKTCGKILRHTSKIKSTDYSERSDNKIIEILEKIFDLFKDLNFDLWAFWVMEAELGIFLEERLSKLLTERKEKGKLLEYQSTLSTKTGLIDAEKE